MKIFITGSEGFIGKRITAALDGLQIPWAGYDLVNGQDIRDPFTLAKAINEAQPTAVLHLAARAGAKLGERYFDEYVTTNILGTYNVVKCTQEAGVNVLVHFSSSSVLGGCEADSKGLSPEDDYDPKSVYGETKVSGELIVRNAKGIPLRAVVRPFSVYGEDGRDDMVLYRWINAVKEGRPITIYGNGKAIRGYTYVGDVANWTCDLLKGSFMHDGKFRTYHFGGADKVTLDRLANVFVRAAGDAGKNVKISRDVRQDWDIQHSFSAPMPEEFTDWAHKPSEFSFDERIRDIVIRELNE